MYQYYLENLSDQYLNQLTKYHISHLIQSGDPTQLIKQHIYLYSRSLKLSDLWGQNIPSNIILVCHNHDYTCNHCDKKFKRNKSFCYYFNGMIVDKIRSYCSICMEDMIHIANVQIIKLCDQLILKYTLMRYGLLDIDSVKYIFKLVTEN